MTVQEGASEPSRGHMWGQPPSQGLEFITEACLIPASQPLHVTGAGKSFIGGGKKDIWGSSSLLVWTPQGIRSMSCTDFFSYVVNVGCRAIFGHPFLALYSLALVPGMQYLIPLEFLCYTLTKRPVVYQGHQGHQYRHCQSLGMCSAHWNSPPRPEPAIECTLAPVPIAMALLRGSISVLGGQSKTVCDPAPPEKEFRSLRLTIRCICIACHSVIVLSSHPFMCLHIAE